MRSVKEYGAAGDGKSLDTDAIQAAVDACSAAGGGAVTVPEGEYVCTTIVLKSHVHLRLELGARIVASQNLAAYPMDCLIFASCADDISITGDGKVIGNGQDDWGSWWGITCPLERRIGLMLFEDCTNITLLGISFLNSDFWTVHLQRCENVEIDHVKILNNLRRLNTDGIDPNSCKNVIISNCHIVAGDDCIVAKSSTEQPTEHLVVSNCILETPNTAIKIGTESYGDLQDIHVDNCVIAGSAVGIGIYVKDGGVVRRVTFSNISVRNRGLEDIKPVLPLFIDIERRHADSRLGGVEDIIFSNINIESEMGALFQGLPERRLKNISLSHITFRVPALRDFSGRKKAITGTRTLRDQQDFIYIRKPAYLGFAHIDGLHLDDINVSVDAADAESCEKSAVFLCDITQESIGAVKRFPEHGELFLREES